MTVQRVKINNIDDKGFVNAIIGNINDIFIDSDLKKYYFDQQLYLFLKENGFEPIIFWDYSDGIYSYEEKSLNLYLNLNKTTSNNNKPKNTKSINDNRPFRKNNLFNSKQEPKEQESHRIITKQTGALQFFQIANEKNQTSIYTRIEKIFDAYSEYKAALIIPSFIFKLTINDSFTRWLQVSASKYSFFLKKHKIFIIYDSEDIFSFRSLFQDFSNTPMDIFFRKSFFNVNNNNELLLNEKSVDCIGLPCKMEIENFLNRERLLTEKQNEIPFFYKVSMQRIVSKLLQERKCLKEFDTAAFWESIQDIKEYNPWDLLAKYEGIDKIKEKFKKQVTFLKKLKENKKIKLKVRPHMVFKGPPGTGKSSIARDFAKILKEEGVLEIGHLVEATVGDLVSQYVGHTRIKTQAICDKAKGGILFIDEAYGLLNSDSQNSYGKEAIEILIQFMENNNDSIVILAGYQNEIDKLLIDGNTGLSSRINKDNHYIFEEYDDKTLMKIAEKIFKNSDFEINDKAKYYLERIIRKKYQRRNSLEWGNARVAEEIVEKIMTNFHCDPDDGNEDIITEKYIPEEWMNLITANRVQGVNQGKGISKLNSLIGLSNMKLQLQKILNAIKVDNMREEKFGIPSNNFKLNFVFLGNPGTGKTTVARLLGDILCDYGLLSESQVIECHRKDIISDYGGGNTASKVEKLFENAIGKVLFFDEAYSIKNSDVDSSGDDAISTIVGNLTSEKYMGKMAFIIAGYPEETLKFINENPGLKSRFNYYINFEDYSNEELWEILKLQADKEKFNINDDCSTIAINWFKKITRNKSFSNGRLCEELFSELKSNFNERISKLENRSELNVDILNTIIKDDFPKPSASLDIKSTTEYLELHKLIGLTPVKESIDDMIESIEFERHQHQEGEIVDIEPKDLHLVFAGPPGTGKTTVARLYGQILKNMGVLSRGNVIEVDKSKLVGQYIGHTEEKVSQVLDSAVGNVLFIDEAYQLANSRYDNSNDYGKVAIDLIMKRMEDDRGKYVVIAAGYTEQMNSFLDANPGLKSRFKQTIEFPNYSNEELLEILNNLCEAKRHTIDEQCLKLTANYLEILEKREGKSFGNAREVRKLYTEVVTQQKKRLNIKRKQGTLKSDESRILIENDFLEAIKKLNKDISIIIANGDSKSSDASSKELVNATVSKIYLNKTKHFKNINPDNLAKAIGRIVSDGNAEGTAFIISSDGYILTCSHCVPNNNTSLKFIINVKNEIKEYDLKLIHKFDEKVLDIAILKINDENLPYFNITDSMSNLKRGADMGLLAYPGGSSYGTEVSYTKGDIARREQGFYFTTANAAPGSSGGPFYRLSDGVVYGILVGGFGSEGANLNATVDLKELLKQNQIEIEFIEEEN
jgi:SpoVK/Ycf46/Vps4 family AAA+-type ATPase